MPGLVVSGTDLLRLVVSGTDLLRLEFNEGCTFAKVAGYVNPVQFVELLNSVLPVAPVNFAEFVGLVNAVRFMEYVNFAELVEGRQG